MLKEIELVGEQKRVLTLPHTGPIQIKGAAGSGKTTVALYRACHLMDTFADLFEKKKVAIFTFNKALVGYLDYLIDGFHGKSYSGVKIINFHKWAYSFLRENNYLVDGNVILDKEKGYCINESLNFVRNDLGDHRILNKPVQFYIDEISWLKGKNIRSLSEYLSTSRVGRGKSERVTEYDKKLIWQVFKQYDNHLSSRGKFDFDDFALKCLDIIENEKSFDFPFTHIVVDEAQDLSKAQVLVLSKIISPTTESISIIADAAQRIYKSGFSWKEVGLNIRGGRTVEFKKNYRNTKQIADAAISLIKNDTDNDDFTDIEVNYRHGNKPKLIHARSQLSEITYILEQIQNIINENENESICIVHRTRSGVESLKISLENHNFRCRILNKDANIEFKRNEIFVSTMQAVKGLEFDNVFICDLSYPMMPMVHSADEVDDELNISTERRLLYTSMTRASEKLFLSYAETQSKFINEMDQSLFDKVFI